MRLLRSRRRVPLQAPTGGPLGVLAGCHVLVVDDDNESRLMLRTALHLEGALVSEADSAKRAIDFAERVRCDVVMTDVTMGRSRRDGIWLLDRFQASPTLSAIPIVAVTGCKELHAALAVRGFADVLIKPIDVVELPRTIAALWHRGGGSGAVARHVAV